MKISRLLLCAALVTLNPSCRRESESAVAHHDEHETTSAEPPMTNRVDVPDAVRRNLGITFAKAENRPVASTIRVPGQFELTQDGRREYRTMLGGRVELVARQFDHVEPGTLLYKLKSPAWRELQEQLSEAESTIRQTEARVASIPLLLQAHMRHEQILEESIRIWQTRVEQLQRNENLGVISAGEIAEAQSTLAAQQAELAEILEKEADLQGQVVTAQAEHDAAHARFRLLIATAATLLDMDEQALAAPYDINEHLHTGIHTHAEPAHRPPATWRLIDDVEVSAKVSGVVAEVELTNGAWASEGSLVLRTINPSLLRFRATALQSDLGRLKSGLPSRIVPPRGGGWSGEESIEASLAVGLAADARERTIDLIAVPQRVLDWSRPGVSAYLEVAASGGESALAIPMSSVVQDGLERVYFRRDPRNSDKVIRMEADLGVSDGRWVVVQSGLREGDEVVLDGVYQLMIATSGSAQKGGHFHPDGTFHAEEDH